MNRRPRLYPRSGRPTFLTGALLRCANAAGGVKELAEAWGVDRTSIRRWGEGQSPRVRIARRANAWARARGIDLPFPSDGVARLASNLA